MASFVFSRLTGLARDMAISYSFGTSPELASYVAAFRLPDLLFQLLAGAALASAFIPTFARYEAEGKEREAWLLTSSVLNLVGLGALVASVTAMLAAPWVVPLIVPGFEPQYQELTVRLTRLMLVSPIFFGVSAIATGVLNARQHFLVPGLAPIFYNLSIMAGALLASQALGVYGLALGVAAGSLLHLLVQIPSLRRQGMLYRPVADLSLPGVREVGRLMAPRVLGLGAVQLNFLVTTILASTLASYSIPALNYAWLLTMMPLGVFGVAISSAVFPTLAHDAAQDQEAALTHTLFSTLRLILFLTIPASLGLIILGEPLITLLFQRGRFDALSAQATNWALLFYAVGLFAHAMVEILVRAFYALRDTRTPVAIGIGAMALNVGLSLVLMRFLAHGGLALAMSLATILEAFLLLGAIRRRLANYRLGQVGGSAARTCLASVIMGGALLALRMGLPWPHPTLQLGFYLAAAISGGAVLYFAVSLALGSQEAKRLGQSLGLLRRGHPAASGPD
jgi:putative peptidoglycan lipid II flippase